MVGRRGQTMLDLLIVLIVLVVGAIMIVVAYSVLSAVNDDIQADTTVSNETRASIGETTSSFASTWDAIFLMAVVLFWIMLIVTSFLIDTNPIFFIISVVLLLVTFLVSMMLANSYADVVDGDLAAFAVQFPFMSWYMGHMLLMVVLMGLTAAIALYSKSRMGGL